MGSLENTEKSPAKPVLIDNASIARLGTERQHAVQETREHCALAASSQYGIAVLKVRLPHQAMGEVSLGKRQDCANV